MHPSPHSHGMHSRLPSLYPQTQISVKLFTLWVQFAKLCCSGSVRSLHRNWVNGAAHSIPKSRSKWHVSACANRLAERVHRTLSGMGGNGVGLLQHGLTRLLQHRVTVTVSTWTDSDNAYSTDWQWLHITTWSDSDCYNMDWQWLHITTLNDSDCYNMDWQWLHITTLNDSDCYNME